MDVSKRVILCNNRRGPLSAVPTASNAPHGQIASDTPEWDYFRFADNPEVNDEMRV